MDFIKNFYKKVTGKYPELYREAQWIFCYIGRYRLSVAFYILIGAAGTAAGFGGSIASKYLIDAVTGHQSGKIASIVSFMIVMAIGNIAAKAFISRVSARISVTVQNEIRAEMFDKILYTEWEELHSYRSGDLLNRMSSDAGIVSGSVISWIPEFITKTVQFFGALGIIFYYDPSMALIALLSTPVTILLSKYLLRRMRSHNKEIQRLGSELMSFQNDSFSNLQTVKAFDLMESFSGRMRGLQDVYEEQMLDYNKFSIYISSLMSFTGMAVSYLCFGWGVYRLWRGEITYGTMTLFLQMSSSVAAAFSALVKMFPSAVSALTSAGRLMAVTEFPKEEAADPEMLAYVREHTEDGVTVEAQKIKMIYKEGNLVFSDVDFLAEPGKIVAVIGPSGEGKTTLIRLLLGLLTPTEGNLTVRTDEEHRCRISSGTREFFSYVPQGNTIFAGTVAENLRLVKPDASEEEMIRALKIGCAYDFVMEHPDGLNRIIGEKGNGLSEGQAQRIAVARAVLKDAPILLLDEATSALDMEIEKQMLKNLMGSRGNRTCIVATHRKSVLPMCDHIYRMNGECLEKLK